MSYVPVGATGIEEGEDMKWKVRRELTDTSFLWGKSINLWKVPVRRSHVLVVRTV
jgi:hypothetical protein